MAKDDYLEKEKNGGFECFVSFHSIKKPTSGWNGLNAKGFMQQNENYR